MLDNFRLLDKYPHYIFTLSGANRYRLTKEYFPGDFCEAEEICGRKGDGSRRARRWKKGM